MYRNANYTAFYVDEPFSDNNLKAHSTKDFCYYHLICAWKNKGIVPSFIDAHDKTYNVRDSSTFDTLKNRLRERLKKSKNILLIMSKITKASKALSEEIDYGVNVLYLPVIILYPEIKS